MAGKENVLGGVNGDLGQTPGEQSVELDNGGVQIPGEQEWEGLSAGDRGVPAAETWLRRALKRLPPEAIKAAIDTADGIVLSDDAVICYDILDEEHGEPEPVLFISFAAGDSWKAIKLLALQEAEERKVRKIQFRSSAPPEVWEKLIPKEEQRAHRFKAIEHIYQWELADGQEEKEG